MARAVQAGLAAGLAGALGIWLLEAVLFVFVQHTDTLASVVTHSAYLAFGPASLRFGPLSVLLGALVHCATACAWGICFALCWPALARRGIEATAAALPFGALAWVVMHLIVLPLFSPNPPSYTTALVIQGLFTHCVAFAPPLALTAKALLPRARR